LAPGQTIADQGEKSDGHYEFHSSRRTSSTVSSPRRPRGCAGQSDAGKCHRRLSKTGLSQHSLVELGHPLRISMRFENPAFKKFHWNFPLALFY